MVSVVYLLSVIFQFLAAVEFMNTVLYDVKTCVSVDRSEIFGKSSTIIHDVASGIPLIFEFMMCYFVDRSQRRIYFINITMPKLSKI